MVVSAWRRLQAAVSVSGLVFGKGVWTFISDNASVRFYSIKGDVGLRDTDSIRKKLGDVSMNTVAMLLRVQQLFPNVRNDWAIEMQLNQSFLVEKAS